jgi:peptide/nickel transport system ATP-binding protein
VGGEIVFQGRDLLTLEEEEMRAIRGGEIGMIFQEPMTSLNPVFSIGSQVVEAMPSTEPRFKEDLFRALRGLS